jgi:AraC-like DNA-binding protein
MCKTLMDSNYTVAISHINNLIWSCQTLGLSTETLKRNANLTEKQLSNPEARASSMQFHQLWQSIEQLSDTPDIGLKIGRNLRFGHWGLIEYISLNASNFSQVMEIVVKYWRLITEDKKDINLRVVDNNHVALSFLGDKSIPAIVYQADMVYLDRVLKLIFGPDVQPVEFWFYHARDENLNESDFRSVLNAPLRFDQSTNAVILSQEQIERPINQDSALMTVLIEQAEKRLKALDKQLSTTSRVTALIESGLSKLSEVAEKLHLGERTLQRRLGKEGYAFNDLLNQVQKNKAQQYLVDNTLSIKEISFLMGFQDERGFYSAVKRWFSLSPTDYRIKHT